MSAPTPARARAARTTSVLAANPGDAFEIDGNVEDAADPRPDWNSLNCLPATNNGGALARTFVPDPSPLTIFTTGGSKDINDVSQWMHTNGNVPDKDDITNAYAAAYNVSGDIVLAFGADRFANNGDSAVGFWFFQNEVGLNPDGTFSGVHAVGDILVISHFTNGGGNADIVVFEWVGSGGSDGALDNITVRATGAIALVNGVTTDPCWAYTPKSGRAGIIPEGSFIEGAINLTAFGINNLCLSSFLVETRSSQEPSAQLKDFALGAFSTRPSADAGADQAACATGSGTSFNLTGTATNAIPATPAWSVVSQDPTVTNVTFGDANAANTSVTITGTGTATLRFTVTSTLGCGDASDDVAVTVNPTSTADAGPDQTKCAEGTSTSFSVDGTASNGTVLWSVLSQDPTVTNVVIATPTSATTNVTVTGTGKVTLRLTVTSASCGAATDDVVLTVNANPTCSITGNDTICEGSSTEFCGPEGLAFYSWSGPDDFMVTTRCTGPISTPGVYTLTVTDLNGCQSICQQTLTVNPVPECSITGTDTICEGGSTEFCGPEGLASYAWSGPGGFTATARCITISVAGIYELTITNASGCQSTCSRTLTVNPLPDCTITGVNAICAGGSTQFCGPAGVASYAWSGPGGFTATSQCITVSVAGTYTLTVASASGCQSTCERTLTVNALPICSIDTPDPASPVCGTSGNTVSAQADQGTYAWSFDAASVAAGWSIDAGQGTNRISYTAGASARTAHLTLVVTSAAGCQSTCSVDITCTAPEVEFCTLTQGAYGNPTGRFNGVGRVQLIQNLLDQGPVTIGKTSGRFITFANPTGGGPDTANCIIAVMPAGSTPGAFPNGVAVTIGGASGNTCSAIPGILLKRGKFNNVLIGQVLALSLNLRLDPSHPLGGLELCSAFVTKRALPGPDGVLGNDNDVVDPNDPGTTRTIPPSVVNALCALGLPLTVDGLLELGNRALAGQGTGGASFADINAAISAINEGFDECRFLVSCTPAACHLAGGLSRPVGERQVVSSPSYIELASALSVDRRAGA